jgi:hypothetical protein
MVFVSGFELLKEIMTLNWFSFESKLSTLRDSSDSFDGGNNIRLHRNGRKAA